MGYAKKLELDNTFIYMDPLEGWKISHYIQDVQSLNYYNHSQVDTALFMIHKLHNANIDSKYSFNIWDIIEKMEGEIQKQGRDKFQDYDSLYHDAEKLFELTEHDKVAKCLCHCNFCNINILIDQNNKFYLINWKYAGNSDPACNIGMFIACSNYSLDEAKNIIHRYLLREPSISELSHYLAYVSVISYYLFL
ncbi:phosphotransferase family protein [Lacrimispora algidixylanolytica]|uniref:phosphotransferase family protein n=1 Tax=Lacrimispora algidixylanolytica TaxID=94868 RepID=UPI001A9B3E07|nr:phosphotransferase [Lacrimispora algidixylanolytica]